MTRPTTVVATFCWLVPAVAHAHGGHADLGLAHGLWHMLPWLAAAAGAAWIVRRITARRRD